MAQTTLKAVPTSGPRGSRHLRVVTEADVLAATQMRQAQWDAMKAGYPGPVRLTKRGRRVVAILVFLPIALFFWLSSSHGVSAADTNPTTKTIVVEPGQSLWDVAVAATPSSDPRKTVFEIKKINHLSNSDVYPGQALVIPLGQ